MQSCTRRCVARTHTSPWGALPGQVLLWRLPVVATCESPSFPEVPPKLLPVLWEPSQGRGHRGHQERVLGVPVIPHCLWEGQRLASWGWGPDLGV